MVRQFDRRSACYGIAPIALLDRTRENERQFALVGPLVWLLAAALKAQAFNSQHNSSVRRILKRNILFHEVHTSPQTEAHHSMMDPTSVWSTVNSCMPHRAACFRHRDKSDKRNPHSSYARRRTLGKLNARNCGSIEFQTSAFAATTSHGGRTFKRRFFLLRPRIRFMMGVCQLRTRRAALLVSAR